MSDQVRVRFAPSPTGGLHIGGVRTALYNYLFAKNKGGKMVLRIEDTDQTRFVEGAEKYITESLEWCGIELDESPSVGGEFGPYRQSERLDIYSKYAQQLLDEGLAYYAFDTSEELDAMRERLQKEKSSVQQYAVATRMSMKNALTMSAEDVKSHLDSGAPYVVRLKVPEGKTISVNDIVRGEVTVLSDTIDDKILLKSDGFPTYHLANVVDDHLMKISHVIRGEEWLPSAPLHALLYDAFGWTDSMPTFAHLPLLLKPEGTGKLSKRDADKHGFPIFPLNWNDGNSEEIAEGFKEQGYIPEAFVNFLAMLGWNPGNDEEIFNMDALISVFELERIGKSGAKFDINKAKWFNEQYLRLKPTEELAVILKEQVAQEGLACDDEKASKIVSLMKERVTFSQDIWNNAKYFFVSTFAYDEKTVRKKWTADAVNVLSNLANNVDTLVFEEEKLKQSLYDLCEEAGTGLGKVMPALRLALSGEAGGPDLMGILVVLGPLETKARLNNALSTLADSIKK